MTRFAAVLLFVPALAAQLATDVFQKAPPVVEEALRARITEFYQLHVDGKFRQAEALVAEESKDFFYSSNKPKYLKFEISRIEWSEEFTKAKATVVCHMFVMMPGFADKPLPVPAPSHWKLVNGQWFWYVDPDSLNATPFGKMKAGTGGGSGGGLPPMPGEKEMLNILNQVKADKTAVDLSADSPSTGQVTISNQMPGTVNIAVTAPKVPGLEIQVDEPAVKSGGKSAVVFRYKPAKERPSGPVTATIRVEPTGQAFPVEIRFGKIR